MYKLYLQGVGDSSQGFLNCVLFIATTPRIRDKICRRKEPDTPNADIKVSRPTNQLFCCQVPFLPCVSFRQMMAVVMTQQKVRFVAMEAHVVAGLHQMKARPDSS